MFQKRIIRLLTDGTTETEGKYIKKIDSLTRLYICTIYILILITKFNKLVRTIKIATFILKIIPIIDAIIYPVRLTSTVFTL